MMIPGISWGVLTLVLALAAFIAGWVTTGPRVRTALLAVFSGALGIVSGYVLYAYASEKAEEGALLKVLGLLLIVGVMSFVFEVLRHAIEGHEAPWPARRIFSTILILAVFELYIVAWHHGLEQTPDKLSHITEVIFGEHFAAKLGPGWNLIALGTLWVAVAIAVAWRLRRYILRMSETPLGARDSEAARQWPDRRAIGRGAWAGFLAAVVWAPVMALGYVALVRAWLMVQWLQADYAGWWRESVEWLLDWTGMASPVRALLWLALSAIGNLAYYGHVVGLVLGLVLIIGLGWSALTGPGEGLWGIPFLAAGAVLLIPLLVNLLLTGDSLWNLVRLCALAMFIWGVPAVLLGTLAPFLRQPAETPRLWGLLAFGAAVVLAAAVVIGTRGGGLTRLEAGVVVGLAVFFVVTGALLWRGPWVTEFWPVLGLSVATLVWAGTSVAQTIDLFHLQRVAHSLISVPLSNPVPPRPVAFGLPAPWLGLDRGLLPTPWPGLERGPLLGGLGTVQLLGSCEPLGRDLDARIEHVRAGAGTAERGRESLGGGVATLRGKADGIETAASAHEGKTARDREPLERQQALVAAARKDAGALTRDIDALATQLRAAMGERATTPPREDCRAILAPRQAALHQELAVRALAYGRVLEQLRPIREDLQRAGRVLDAIGPAIDRKLEKIRIRLAQQLELAVTASFGFWTTVGMLAMWSLLDRSGRAGHHA
jgi:hypothetical protein